MGTIGTVYSQAILAGRTGAGLHRALEGEVYASAGAAAAGVRGSAVAAGQFAVLADCAAPGGTALRVNGVASFSRSGRGSISHGHAGTTVTVPSGVATGALILVTLQGSAGSGVYLRYAKRTTATTFQVVLNKTATSKVSFAWMILN
jgi:hypothetical protein